jgi:hypothetical protein
MVFCFALIAGRATSFFLIKKKEKIKNRKILSRVSVRADARASLALVWIDGVFFLLVPGVNKHRTLTRLCGITGMEFKSAPSFLTSFCSGHFGTLVVSCF